MVIKVTKWQQFEIERLRRAIDFGVTNRTKLKSQFWDKSSSISDQQQTQCVNGSLQSSGYCSLQTSQDKDDKEVPEESWDTDLFDPQRPYCK